MWYLKVCSLYNPVIFSLKDLLIHTLLHISHFTFFKIKFCDEGGWGSGLIILEENVYLYRQRVKAFNIVVFWHKKLV